MRIVLCGCGKIGRSIIASLVNEKHDVVAVDINPRVVAEVRNNFDIIAITGNGTEYETLKDVQVDRAELFIAVTPSDELNMLACFAAKRMGAKHTVARIRELEYNADSLNFIKHQLELSLAINPERMAAEAIFNIIKLPSASKVEIFPSSKLEMIEIQLKADSVLDGLALIDIRKQNKANFLICAVEREGQIHIPNGGFVLKGNDKIGIIAHKRDIPKVLRALGLNKVQIKDIMILGASTIAIYLAQMLLSARHSVKLIDSDPEVCEEVCETLPDSATVICGNGMSQELLVEEGILSTDAFVSLTGKDEINILMSFYAMKQNLPKVIAKVNHQELASLATELGLDSIITARKIVADLIVKYARAIESTMGSQIETLYSFMDGMAEALEFKVLQDFEFDNIPLKQLKLSENVLIAGISRGKESFIPSGDDTIHPGDKVVVIAEGKRLLSLSDIIVR